MQAVRKSLLVVLSASLRRRSVSVPCSLFPRFFVPLFSCSLVPLSFACFFPPANPSAPTTASLATTRPPPTRNQGLRSVVPPTNPQNGNWQPANPSDGMLKGKWWQIYQDPQLNQLEDRIATNNVQLKQALETYLAARDQVAVQRAALLPAGISERVTAGREILDERTSFQQIKSTVYSDFTIQGQATWEPDFWGRIRRTVEQARANAQASAADIAAVDLTLHAEMATDYFALRGLDSQIKLLTETVADLEHQLDLTQRRFKGGVATQVDVEQAAAAQLKPCVRSLSM